MDRLVSNSGAFDYQTILDSIPIAVARISRDYHLMYANERFYQLTPESRKNRSQKICPEMGLPDELISRWLNALGRVFTTGVTESSDFLDSDPNTLCFRRTHFLPEFDSDGVVNSVLLIGLSHDTLAPSHLPSIHESYYRSFLEKMPVIAWIRDEQERYVYLNQLYQQMMNALPAEWYGKHITEMWPPDIAAKFMANDKKTLELNEPIRSEEVAPTPDGIMHTWMNVKFTFQDQTGKRYFGGVGLDISEMKRAESERSAYEMSLLHAQKLESLGVMASGIAHDFNNLMTAVIGYAGLGRDHCKHIDGILSDCFSQIEHAAYRAAELCGQMRSYAGLEQSHITEVDLNSIVRDSCSFLTFTLLQDIIVRFDLDSSIPLILADAHEVNQVVKNLLTNAAEAIGSHPGQITISTSNHFDSKSPPIPEPCVCLQIIDTGSGIPADIKPRIFEPFFSTKFVGRGLGLSAVQGIIRRHKGYINVESTAGVGTTVLVYWPSVAKEHDKSVQVQPNPPLSGRGRTILVIDDEEGIRTLTRQVLEGAGFRVLLAADGPSGITLANTALPHLDLLICDLTMPGMSGSEVASIIHKMSPSTKILLSSGYVANSMSMPAIDENYATFFPKPYRIEELLAAVVNQIGP